MIKDLRKLNNSHFELLVVGGGIYGAIVFWLATVAGLKCALIEQADFGHATSANSQKIIHGGLRYLRTLDINRLWQSLRERNRLMWLAPHLVHPLRCTMPLYGHGTKGKEVFAAAAYLYNAVANVFYARTKQTVKLPGASLIGREEFLGFFPEFEMRQHAGAAVWYEGLCQNTERLVLSFIKTADKLGGVAANYVKALKYKELTDDRVAVSVRDEISNQSFEILTARVINCTGPWYKNTVANIDGGVGSYRQNFAVGINLVTRQILSEHTAIGLSHSTDGSSRLFFIVPWCNKSIIGTKWVHVNASIDRYDLEEAVCSDFMDQFNRACPETRLGMHDVEQVHWGFVPCRRNTRRSETPSIATRFRIIDASRRKNGKIVNVIGVKYTTAADVARKALKVVFPELRMDFCSESQLADGGIENFSGFRTEMIKKWKDRMSESLIERLVINYGTDFETMLSEGNIETTIGPDKNGCVTLSELLNAQTLYAVRCEMAQRLSDVVFRRTEQGSTGCPTRSTLQEIGLALAGEFDWSRSRLEEEIEEVNKAFPAFVLQRRSF
jgi:glycerol-3-phosphate dehydrogenase